MRVISIVLGCMALGALATAGAQTPPVATPSAAPATPASAPPAAAAPAAAPASNASAASAAAATAAIDRKMISRGYKPEMAGNDRVYCRKEDQIGTRLAPKKVCLTAEQADLAEHDAKEYAERLQRSGKPIGGG
ncbi:MAG: hypothetical protein JSR36_11430 [Proteobacteria bacterium]|nr:hypothetical protein [Pseudomonadota bacterium]